jgi:carboxymethylenebutenolidase
MGQNVTLQAEDGHRFGGYRANPAGQPRGGIVIIQ